MGSRRGMRRTRALPHWMQWVCGENTNFVSDSNGTRLTAVRYPHEPHDNTFR